MWLFIEYNPECLWLTALNLDVEGFDQVEENKQQYLLRRRGVTDRT